MEELRNVVVGFATKSFSPVGMRRSSSVSRRRSPPRKLDSGTIRQPYGSVHHGRLSRNRAGCVMTHLELLQMDWAGGDEPQNIPENVDYEACDISLEERIVKTNPVWFLPDLQRLGAVHLLQGKEEGSFLVRESSRNDTLALSVRLPLDKGPHVQHYIIERRPSNCYAIETSEKAFTSLPALLVHYCGCCDELPVRLMLPQCISDAKTRHELASIALLGQEFWGTNMASPSPISETEKQFPPPQPKRPHDLAFSSFGKSAARPSPLTPLTPLAALFNGGNLTPTRPAPPVPTSDGGFVSFKCPNGKKSSQIPPITSPSNITVTTTLTFNVSDGTIDSAHSNSSSDHENQPNGPLTVEVSNLEISPNRDSLRLHFRHSISPPKSIAAENSPPKERPSSHYHESNIVDATTFYRSSLADKISDYEDLWTSPTKEIIEPNFQSPEKGESEPPTPMDCINRQFISNNLRPLATFKPKPDVSKSLGDLSEASKSFQASNGPEGNMDEIRKTASPFYVEPLDALQDQKPIGSRLMRKAANRYSDSNLQWRPYRQSFAKIDSNDNLSESPEDDNMRHLRRSRNGSRAKPVLPPTIDCKKIEQKANVPWRLDSSWQYLNYTGSQEDMDTFIDLQAEESSVIPGELTVNSLIRDRLPHLSDVTGSALYDNCPNNIESKMNGNHYYSPTISDSGTEFSEPWDSNRWAPLLQGIQGDNGTIHENTDTDSLVQVTGESGPSSHEDSDAESACPRQIRNLTSKSNIMSPQLIALRHKRDALEGASIRSYTLDLGRDMSSVFSQAVTNFLTCTRESTERDPYVVCRNVRQFMSGMKNFLVTSGERDFQATVTRERSNLKSTEFLNLDAILEDVLVRLVLRPIWGHLNQLFVDYLADNGAIDQLAHNIHQARSLSGTSLGLKSDAEPLKGNGFQTIQTLFAKMMRVYAPREKLASLLGIVSVIYKLGNKDGSESHCDADCLVPVLAWAIAHCGVIGAEVEAAYLESLLVPSASSGDAAYYLHAFQSSIHLLKTLNQSTKSSTHSLQMEGKDLSPFSSEGVLRVIIPDEHNGSLLTKTVPVRPGCSARQVCKMLAHKLTVSNPQDYGLYKLIDGQETLLADNDYPQKIKSELEAIGVSCMIAFKRIEAKIAWPMS